MKDTELLCTKMLLESKQHKLSKPYTKKLLIIKDYVPLLLPNCEYIATGYRPLIEKINEIVVLCPGICNIERGVTILKNLEQVMEHVLSTLDKIVYTGDMETVPSHCKLKLISDYRNLTDIDTCDDFVKGALLIRNIYSQYENSLDFEKRVCTLQSIRNDLICLIHKLWDLFTIDKCTPEFDTAYKDIDIKKLSTLIDELEKVIDCTDIDHVKPPMFDKLYY
jgi:hypothetical protein